MVRSKFSLLFGLPSPETETLKHLKRILNTGVMVSIHLQNSASPILPAIMLIIYLLKVASMNYLQHKFDGDSIYTLVLQAELCRAYAAWVDRIWISPRSFALYSLTRKTVPLRGSSFSDSKPGWLPCQMQETAISLHFRITPSASRQQLVTN